MARASLRLAFFVSLAAVAVGVAGLALNGRRGAEAQTSAPVRTVPESRAQVQLSFAPVVQRTAPTVVNVYGARVERQPRNPFFDDPFFRRFFGEEGFGVPQERVRRSLGSGVIVDPSGLVVTNHHVIEGMEAVKVALVDRREFEAEIVLRDPRTDLAVLRIKNAPALTSVEIGDADNLLVGDIVLAIGNPFGVGQTVTQGIVSALARTNVGVSDFQSFIQTDAAINPGNSGGALVDMAGRLVGINTAIFSKTGASHGIGFAIPSSMVRVVIDSARSGGNRVRRPWFGATLQVIGPDVAETLGLDRPAGALVAALAEKGPAAESGLRRGDVIVSVDGVPVDDPDAFGYRFGTRGLSGTAALGIVRGGQRQTLAVKLGPAPEIPARDALILRGRTPFTGAEIVNLSPATAEELSVDPALGGIGILAVASDSPAAQVGFRRGDVILAVNGERIATTRVLERMVSNRARYWEVTLSRGGRTFTSVFGG